MTGYKLRVVEGVFSITRLLTILSETIVILIKEYNIIMLQYMENARPYYCFENKISI